MRAFMLTLAVLALMWGGCARDWPVPVRNFSQGTVALPGDVGSECRMVAHVLDDPADARARLGPGFATMLREELGISVPPGAAVRIPTAEVEQAMDRVAWGQEMGVLLMAGPCHPGFDLDRVVQPGTGAARWELRIGVDPQPGTAAVSWILAGAVRGNAQPMTVDEPVRRLRPGRDRLVFTAWPDRSPAAPTASPPGAR